MSETQPTLPEMPDQSETVAILRAEVRRLTGLLESEIHSRYEDEEDGDHWYSDELREKLHRRSQPMDEIWRAMNDQVALIEEANSAKWKAEQSLRRLQDVEAFAHWLNRSFGRVFNLRDYGNPQFNRYAALEAACRRVSEAFPEAVEGPLKWTLEAVRNALAMPLGPCDPKPEETEGETP